MKEKHKIHRTIMPSGVFRQPREDILQDSVSQCVVNQDSLCKVSDFEISIHSKYNLPDLCNVDGKGRAVYWLYKHSLADSESVRNSKIRTCDTREGSLFFASDSRTSIFSAVKNGKSCVTKRRKLKKNLRKFRDIFLASSANSDIEIKETYNSYINLKDLQTVDLLLKGNEDIGIDKYDNLMMNLELRRIMLEKEQIQQFKTFISQNMKGTNNYLQNKEYYLENTFNTKNCIENIKKIKRRKEMLRKSKRCSVNSGSTDANLLNKSRLGTNDLDHILNQIKFFLFSGKFNEITDTQKTELENYLRVLSEESTSRALTNGCCENFLHNKQLKDTIRESLRDLIAGTIGRQTSSLIVETDSDSDICDSPSQKSIKRLKESRAQSNINLSNVSLVISSHDVSDKERLSSYPSDHSEHSEYSDLVKKLSEKELKSHDLRFENIPENITDKLILKQYRLGSKDDLVDFTKPKKPLGFKRKDQQKEHKVDTLKKFRNVRCFDEADTFRSLQLKNEQKKINQDVKHPPPYPNYNICITEPEQISYTDDLDELQLIEAKMKILEKLKSKKISDKTTEPKAPNVSSEKIYKRSEKNSLSSKKMIDIKKNLGKTISTLSNKSNKSEDNISEQSSFKLEDKKEDKLMDCICFNDKLHATSDIAKDITEDAKKTKVKSNSFPKAKKSPEKLSNILKTHKETKFREHSRHDRAKREETKKVAQSDNCIDGQIKPAIKHRIKREKELHGEKNKREKKLREEKTKTEPKSARRESRKKSAEHDKRTTIMSEKRNDRVKEKESDKAEYKLFVNINALHDSTVEITSRTKRLRSPEESILHTKFFDEVERQLKGEDVKEVSKMREMMKYRKIEAPRISDKAPRLIIDKDKRSISNHVIHINDSLIHIDEKNIFKATDAESMENFLKNEMLSTLHKSLVPNECEEKIDGSINIPIFKKGVEIARITRQSPSCAYTIKKYVQKMNKSTQMFEHVTKNDLYTLQWIHDNLFEININPHTLIVDEKIKEVSEISDVS